MPMGVLSFGSTTLFDVIRIKIPPAQLAALFLLDNFIVQLPARPQLSIGLIGTNAVVISWTTNWDGYVLQQNPVCYTTNWVNVTNSVSVVDGQNQVIVSPLVENRYFRLVHP